ncbi:MAG TPA: metal ABC transporter ATP-binding protein [Deltaproteobacteria bacterium]|nr:metal ABC transporter ATP-binding protein [Deltaproteobacteria bacterium]HQB37853.1 metal ABC transporter ATP-binding protein [Deltaproteobacteria bacterium]
MRPVVVATESLCCSYNGGMVLENISVTIGAGDYVGIVGPNGSGKSTLLKAILGLCELTAGRVSLFGSYLEAFSGWGRVGYLPQSLAILNPLFPATVAETVALGLLSRKSFPRRLNSADRERVDAMLERLGVQGLRNRLIGELSGGQQQRVFLARALVNDPELLILDEPTSALDPETRERFYRQIAEINALHGTTVLFVTHDMGVIGAHATKMLYLDKKMLFFGSFEEFCHSRDMSLLFGEQSQHIICHRH